MTRTALSSPPTPNRAADVRRAAIGRGPDRAGHDGPDLRSADAAMRFVLADQCGRSIAHPGSFEETWADTPAEGQADARVIIIGCEHRLFVHTLAKNWAMTVRQIGMVPPSLGQKTETMIPYVASRARSWPQVAVTERERPGIPAPCGGERGRGRPRRRALMVAKAMVGRLEVQTRRRGRPMNQAPAGHWGAGSSLCVPVARGVRYNWKGPPTILPLRAPRSLPAQGRIQFRVH
jgi:hypothetical protein